MAWQAHLLPTSQPCPRPLSPTTQPRPRPLPPTSLSHAPALSASSQPRPSSLTLPLSLLSATPPPPPSHLTQPCPSSLTLPLSLLSAAPPPPPSPTARLSTELVGGDSGLPTMSMPVEDCKGVCGGYRSPDVWGSEWTIMMYCGLGWRRRGTLSEASGTAARVEGGAFSSGHHGDSSHACIHRPLCSRGISQHTTFWTASSSAGGGPGHHQGRMLTVLP